MPPTDCRGHGPSCVAGRRAQRPSFSIIFSTMLLGTSE